jgi:L-lactate dehydrogenase (cytochrome)
MSVDPKFAEIEWLRSRAKKRIPRFAFEYLDGGCNSEVNLKRNTEKIREVLLKPVYLNEVTSASLETNLFGESYSAPFGVAPIGLQGMIWPGASEILAKAAFEHRIPYILSTVGTASIERISEITEGKAWFQLYHPVDDALRDDLLQRAWDAGIKVLVLLADVPSFGYRSKEIRNGLSIPPRMTFSNFRQVLSRPAWANQTIRKGPPTFKTLEKYTEGSMNLKHLGAFMNRTFDGRLDVDKLKSLRDRWQGKLVLKGVASMEDAQKCVELGLDGLIVSNHGGRQLDHGEAAIESLPGIAENYRDKLTVMMDSGIRTGPDIASTLAAGADFTFLGRSFMYGVAALGEEGGDHTISLLKKQLTQVMDQLQCASVSELPSRRI